MQRPDYNTINLFRKNRLAGYIDNSFKRFHYRGRRLVKAEFATIAVAHNIRKIISNGYGNAAPTCNYIRKEDD